MTHQLNRMNFVKVLPTPSLTGFCLQFKHYKTGELLHVLWTLRGKRTVTQLDLVPGAKITVHDSMDNPVSVATGTFTITTSPCYLRGLKSDAQIVLGDPDHSDAKLG